MNQMAIWIDGNEARVFHVDADRFDEKTVHSPNHHVHRHQKVQQAKIHNHPDDEQKFFHEVAKAVAEASAVLVVGPAMTKLHFFRYLQKNDPALDKRIVGLETADHPTDRQIVAHVRSYFATPAVRL